MKALFPPAPGSAKAADVPKLGALKQRPAALKKDEGEIFAVLERYLDNTIPTVEKRSRCAEELDILSIMESVTKEVLGRPKDDAKSRAELKPSPSSAPSSSAELKRKDACDVFRRITALPA